MSLRWAFYLSFGAWQREIAGTKYPGHLMRQETWNMTFGLRVWWSGENIIWNTMDCTYFGKLCFGSFNLFWLACLFAFVHIFWVYGCSVPIRFLGCMVFAWLKIQNMFISSQGEMDILNAVPFFKTHYIVFFKYVYIYIRCSFSKPRNHTGEVYHEGSLVWTRTSFVQPQIHAYDRQMFFSWCDLFHECDLWIPDKTCTKLRVQINAFCTPWCLTNRV